MRCKLRRLHVPAPSPANRIFSSCCEPHYESEAKSKTFQIKISFLCISNRMQFFSPIEPCSWNVGKNSRSNLGTSTKMCLTGKPKCLRIQVPNSKYLRSKEPQSESCCLSNVRNLQMQCADSLETSVGRSMWISAQCTQAERSRTSIINCKVRGDKSPLVNQQCDVYHYQSNLCDAGYVDYTCRHLHQRIGYVRVAVNLTMKARLKAKLFK